MSQVDIVWVGDDAAAKLFYCGAEGPHGRDTAAAIELVDDEVGRWRWVAYRPAWTGPGRPPERWTARIKVGDAYTPDEAKRKALAALAEAGATFVIEVGGERRILAVGAGGDA